MKLTQSQTLHFQQREREREGEVETFNFHDRENYSHHLHISHADKQINPSCVLKTQPEH